MRSALPYGYNIKILGENKAAVTDAFAAVSSINFVGGIGRIIIQVEKGDYKARVQGLNFTIETSQAVQVTVDVRDKGRRAFKRRVLTYVRDNYSEIDLACKSSSKLLLKTNI